MLAALAGRIYDHAPQQNAVSLDAETSIVTRNERTGPAVAIQCAAAKIDALSDKLANAMAAWERANANRTAPPAIASVDEELADLEKQRASASEDADRELLLATDWNAKALLAVRAGRDDLAKQAILQATNHRDASEILRAEADLLAQGLEQLRRAQTTAQRTPRA